MYIVGGDNVNTTQRKRGYKGMREGKKRTPVIQEIKEAMLKLTEEELEELKTRLEELLKKNDERGL